MVENEIAFARESDDEKRGCAQICRIPTAYMQLRGRQNRMAGQWLTDVAPWTAKVLVQVTRTCPGGGGRIHRRRRCGRREKKERRHAHVGACASFGELVATRTSQHFVLQGGDGGGRLVDHVAFVGNVKEAGDEEDEKAGYRGSLSRTLGS